MKAVQGQLKDNASLLQLQVFVAAKSLAYDTPLENKIVLSNSGT